MIFVECRLDCPRILALEHRLFACEALKRIKLRGVTDALMADGRMKVDRANDGHHRRRAEPPSLPRRDSLESAATRWSAGAHRVNRNAPRARALAASSMRLRGGACVSSEWRSLREAAAISSTAAWNAASLALEGLAKPLTLRTNWSAADRISSSVTGGSKLNRILMFRHMRLTFDFTRVCSKQAGQADG